jgi:hypothetical protein
MALIKESELPSPRLEFRWSKDGDTWNKRICTYALVLPLGEYDIRREQEDGKVNDFSVVLSTTCVSGGKGIPMSEEEIDTPYRDGAHAKWDCIHIGNPPIYAVCEGFAMLVEKNK